MRILYVTQVSLNGNNGGVRHVLGVTKGLAALGHEVELVAPRERLRRRRVPRRRPRTGTALEVLQGLIVARHITRARPDVACVRICPSTSVVPRVLEIGGIPTVLELNGPILDELDARGGGQMARGVVQRLLERVVHRSGPVIVPLASIGDYARTRLRAQDVEVVESGCDLAIAVPASRLRARRSLGLPPDRPCVAFTGTLANEQRLDLLEAAAQLPGVQLLIAGDGPGARRIAAAAARAGESSIRWFGSIAHERAVEIARAADVCLDLKPLHVGMKCLEYAALGRRIVAFDAPGAGRLRALYPDHQVVFTLRDGSAGELRAAIESAIAVEAADPLPAPSVALARRHLGWERTARSLARVLEERIMAAVRRADGASPMSA
jgi:glycosyltransferase involved in cell wall biosynthesis